MHYCREFEAGQRFFGSGCLDSLAQRVEASNLRKADCGHSTSRGLENRVPEVIVEPAAGVQAIGAGGQVQTHQRPDGQFCALGTHDELLPEPVQLLQLYPHISMY